MTEKDGRKEWKAASNLQKGDKLSTENGESVCVEEVRIEKLEESVKVYNHDKIQNKINLNLY